MSRNILSISLLLSGFFMLLSLILRAFFFVDYISLVTQPLFIFMAWFAMTTVILFYLKRDFTGIYELLIFFEEGKSVFDIQNDALSSQAHSSSSKKLDLQDSNLDDYSEFFQEQGVGQKSEDSNQARSSEENEILNFGNDFVGGGEEWNEVAENLKKQNPKNLAKLVKEYINESNSSVNGRSI